MTEQSIVFSIVTPSFNQGEFLAEAIESIISQKGDFFIDYIIVDGGSTDNSVAIIKHYDGLLQNGEWGISCRGITYRWMSEQDKGQTDALMKGFRMASGDIFAWLNSDDIYLPGALQIVSGFFRNNSEIGLLYGDAHYCDADGTIIGGYRTEDFDPVKLAWYNFICQPSAFFRRETFDIVGGLDESLHYSLDFDLWIKIGKLFPCRHIPGYLSMFRLHDASKSIRDETLIKNCEEGLAVAIKHFDWAPLTRVYTSCRTISIARLPAFLNRSQCIVTFVAVIFTIIRSIRLNKGLRKKDLKLLNRENFRKLFKSRIEIITGNNN
jgi:glycosyltransferase involved in cell wall biosynthesis